MNEGKHQERGVYLPWLESALSAARRQLSRGSGGVSVHRFADLHGTNVIILAGILVSLGFGIGAIALGRNHVALVAMLLLASIVATREWALREPERRLDRAVVAILGMVFVTVFGVGLVSGTFRAPQPYFFGLVTMGAAYGLGLRAAVISTVFAVLACATLGLVGAWLHPPVLVSQSAVSLPVNQMIFHFAVLALAGATRKLTDDLTGELRDLNAGLEKKVEQRTAELTIEIGEGKRVEEERRAVSEELLKTSRLAGMAEMATSVLHNVGNVLNSANISAHSLSNTLRDSKISSLDRVVQLLRDHEDDLPGYFASDPQATSIIPFLGKLGGKLRTEHETCEEEVASLLTGLDHIRMVITAQQSGVRGSQTYEAVTPRDLIAAALHFGLSDAPEIEVRMEEEEDLPSLLIDPHAAIQILVNLLKNAKDSALQARDAYPDNEAAMVVMIVLSNVEREGNPMLEIQVVDQGMGISSEHLERIFDHGFTTKKTGHGFGLRASQVSAVELGGSLTVYSAGPGEGASLTLTLPYTLAKPDAPAS